MSLQLSFLFLFGIDLYGKKANIFHVFNQHCNQIEKNSYLCGLEKPLYFDPFGQIEFAPVVHNIIAPCKVLVQGSILFYPFRDSGFS